MPYMFMAFSIQNFILKEDLLECNEQLFLLSKRQVAIDLFPCG